MKKIMILATPILVFALPAFAGPDCTSGTGPVAPMWKLAQAFENDGGKIDVMKVSDGCYEIYGTLADQDVEIYFDPRTLVELQREEG